MVGAVTEHFEHYLSWTIGALIDYVNARLIDLGTETRFCPELGNYIRYGVDSPHALTLTSSGIRSRRLAHAVAAELPSDVPAAREDLRSWLAETGITGWRERFEITAAETLDLLEFTRARRRSLLRALLETGTVTIDMVDRAATLPTTDHPLTLEPARGEPDPAPLAIYADHERIAYIASQDHADVQSIIDTGLELALRIDRSTEPASLQIATTATETEP
jgi:hypothetical protein